MENEDLGHTETHQALMRGLALEILEGEAKSQAQRTLLSCAACLEEYNAYRDWIGLMADPAGVEPWETYLKEKNTRRYNLYRQAVGRLAAHPTEEGAFLPQAQSAYRSSVRLWRNLAFALASLLLVLTAIAIYQRAILKRELADVVAYYQQKLTEQARRPPTAVQDPQDRRRVEELSQQIAALTRQHHEQAGTIEDLRRRLEQYLGPHVNATLTVPFFARREPDKVPEITWPKERLFFNFEIRVAEEAEYPEYRMVLRESSGDVLWQSDRARKDSLGNFSLLVDKSFLRPGGYTLELYGIGPGQPVLLARHLFRLKG